MTSPRKLEPIQPQKDIDPEVDYEFGVTQVLPFAAWTDFTGRSSDGKRTISNSPDAISLEKLVEMRRKDGQARALMRLITLPIRSALKEAEWVASEDGEAEQEVEFANQMFTLPSYGGGMEVSLSKFLRQTLLALTDGFAAFEEVRRVPDDGPLKGKIVIRKMAYRDPRTIQFNVDENGEFDGIHQIAQVGEKHIDVSIAKEKVWYYAANEEENPFYGVSYFEPAYRHYDFKRKLYYVSHVAAQFAAVPGRIGITPPSPDTRMLANFKTALANFAFNTAISIPEGYEVKAFNGNTQFDFMKLIDHHNMMMAASVLAKFLQQEDRQVLIDNGKADATADMFVFMIESIMTEIAESWTCHLMPKYIDWNFGSKKYPIFRFGQLADAAKDAIKEIFENVVIAGALNCTPEFVRELEKKLSARLGLDIDYSQIEQYEQEAAQAQQEIEAQAAQQQQQMLDMQQAAGLPPSGVPGAPKPQGGPPKPQGGISGPSGAVAATSTFVDVDDLVAAAASLLNYEDLGPELDAD